MKNIKTLLIILAAPLVFTACEKEESPDLLSISGEVLAQDALTPTITSPLEDITVYLLNSPFTIDTTALWFTKTDVLDSTKTDANGLYKFSELKAGDYEVMPIDTIMGYLFEKSADSDNTIISTENSQSNYTVNFTSPEVLAENSPSVTFHFNNSGDYTNCRITVSRQMRKRIWGVSFGKWYYDLAYSGTTRELGASTAYTYNTFTSFFLKYSNQYKIQCNLYDPDNTHPKYGYIIPSQLGKPRYIETNNQKTNYDVDITWDGETTTIKLK